MKNLRVFIALIAIAVGSSSCERILDFQANSNNQIPADSAILNIQDAQELLVSVYDVAANAFNGRFQNIPEVMSDHIADPLGLNGEYAQIWRWTSSFFNGSFGGEYRDAYIAIYRANTLIEEVADLEGATADAVARITAEAKFIRALSHYHVVRIWALALWIHFRQQSFRDPIKGERGSDPTDASDSWRCLCTDRARSFGCGGRFAGIKRHFRKSNGGESTFG